MDGSEAEVEEPEWVIMIRRIEGGFTVMFKLLVSVRR